MKKVIFCTFFLLTMYLFGFGQQKIRQDSVTQAFTLVDQASRIGIQLEERATTNQQFRDLFKAGSLSIKDADLQFSYRLAFLEKRFHYQIRTFLINEKRDTIFPEPYRMDGDVGLIHQNQFEPYQFVWKDFLEKVGNYGEKHELVIDLSLYGYNLDCGDPPKMPFKDHLPYLSAAVLGGGLLVIGGFFYEEAEQANTDYVQIWESGGALAEGQPLRSNYESRRNINKILNYTGLGILALDGVLYLIRLLKHGSRVRKFNKYCGPKKRTQIEVRPTGLSYNGFRPGIRFSKKF